MWEKSKVLPSKEKPKSRASSEFNLGHSWHQKNRSGLAEKKDILKTTECFLHAMLFSWLYLLDITTIPILELGKVRLREAKELLQGQRAKRWRSRNVTHCNLILGTIYLTTLQYCPSPGDAAATWSLPVGRLWKPSVTPCPVSMNSRAQGVEPQSLHMGPSSLFPAALQHSCLELEPDHLESTLFPPDIWLTSRELGKQ